jgi:hypothetical protein
MAQGDTGSVGPLNTPQDAVDKLADTLGVPALCWATAKWIERIPKNVMADAQDSHPSSTWLGREDPNHAAATSGTPGWEQAAEF